MRQRGAILVFKPGTPKTEIRVALKMISCLLDDQYNETGETIPWIKEFDPKYGGPVFYIP